MGVMMSGQLHSAAGVAHLKRRRYLHERVVKERRPPTYPQPWATAYGVPMGDASRAEDWAGYLRRMTSRPGWSVARLARESGIHRGTIFKWMKGGSGVTVSSVRAIAKALGDDPANALRAAGNVADVDGVDPDVRAIVRQLEDPTVSEARKATIRATLQYLARLADQEEPPEQAAG